MFWGLIMEPHKRYTQIVDKPFHLSMASLDASTATGGLVQVMMYYEERNYLLCTLQKDKVLQVPLDLNFERKTKISFTCNGDGHVHLTGFAIPEEDDDDLEDLEDEDEEEDEVPMLVDNKKRKALEHSKDKNNLKRAKISKSMEVEDEDDDDDSDSELGAFDTDDSEDLSEDEDGDLEDSDDDDDDDEEEDDEDEEEEQVKPSKKEKQNQNKQKTDQKQNNQQQNKDKKNKKDKNKMMNGKQETIEKDQSKQKKNKNDSKNDSKSDDGKIEQQQKKRTIEGGVQVQDIKVGNGAPAKPGRFVSVYYVGKLKNGKKFDATQQGDGFKFRLGKGEVIKGWDVGVAGMKVGGKRLLQIPPNMAYGAKGSPPVIPPNSWLNFEVELKSIH